MPQMAPSACGLPQLIHKYWN